MAGGAVSPTVAVVPLGMPLIVGPGVTVAAAKIASLFLATIGVMMLRVGLLNTFANLNRGR